MLFRSLPDTTFESTLTLTLGDRRIELAHLGAGQNPGDTVVHFPHARAVFAGGVFSSRDWPDTRFTPSVDGWIELLRRIAAMDADVFLPGHGDVGRRQDLFDQARLLADLQASVRGAMSRGLTREEIVDTLQFPAYAELRNYGRLHDLIESLHHLYSTGRPRIGP